MKVLGQLGFLLCGGNFLWDDTSGIPRPAEEEVSDIFVVSFPLVMHLGLHRRGGLAATQLAVERFALRGGGVTNVLSTQDWRVSPLSQLIKNKKEHLVFLP